MDDNRVDDGNGDSLHSGSDHTPEEWARIAADHALAAHQGLGTLAAEVSSLRKDMTEGFKRLGVKVRAARGEMASISDEIEDSKVHNLRVELRQYKARSKWVISLGTAVIVLVLGGVILHLLHIGP
jgi:hypothetical protein